MKNSRYTEEEIALATQPADNDTPVSEAIRKMSITEPTCLTLEEAVCQNGLD
ncbi:hypothetical protein [Microvirga arabica]|uniref:hypothetical protein n=1 Tax=Microvirga arabica TaxID=1128671 RepID=UPI001939C7C9|nr:hypothetical protein [Microvirga arabica]MBM1175075.1 hypothetical protein [Microvirga arabica]